MVKLPFSISENEFNYMKDFILKCNLKNGFELATGGGISTISIGYALKENGGKLLSIDSYEEEIKQKQPTGNNQIEIENSVDFENNKKLMNLFNLNNVILKKGWSPNNCIYNIEKYFDKLDFIFLDCPKTDQDFIRDIKYLINYLDEKYAIFVHDTHVMRPPFNNCKRNFEDIVNEYFNLIPIKIQDFEYGENNFHQNAPLALITNIEL